MDWLEKFYSAAEKIYKSAYRERRLFLDDSGFKSLTKASPGTIITVNNNLAIDSSPMSRAPKQTKNNIDDSFGELEESLLSEMHKHLDGKKLICLDRKIGTNGPISRLIVPLEFVSVAYMGGKLFESAPTLNPSNYIVFFYDDNFEKNKGKKLDQQDITIRLAMGEDGRVVKVVRNSNYMGEWKKGNFAAMEWYAKKNTDGIFLHAGCRQDFLEDANTYAIRDVRSLFVALSANGKTTLTCKILGKKERECSFLVQDDGGTLYPDGSFEGFESGAVYVKTEGVSIKSQMEIFYGLLRPNSVLENVHVDERGVPDFFDYRKTRNGRAVIERRDITHTSDYINVDRIDNLFLITRGPLIPAISKLTSEEAVAWMILGQAMGGSADGSLPTIKHEFFYDPFFAGDKLEHIERLYGILNNNPKMNFYLLNTGWVGPDEKTGDISLETTLGVLDSVLRGGLVNWEDSAGGFKVPVSIRAVGKHFRHPSKLYTAEEYESLEKKDRIQRIQGLEKISGLPDKIKNAIAH